MNLFILTVMTYGGLNDHQIPETVFARGDWHDVLGVFSDASLAKLAANARNKGLSWVRLDNREYAYGQIGLQPIIFNIVHVQVNTIRLNVDQWLHGIFEQAMEIGSELVQ